LRVIVVCVPQTGHILPLLRLAQAYAGRGDEVIIASGPDAAGSCRPRLSFRPIGPAFGPWFAALRGRTRGVPGDGLAPWSRTRHDQGHGLRLASSLPELAGLRPCGAIHLR
jgi:hypothetical protein